MPFTYPRFDVKIERSISSHAFAWPAPGEAMDDAHLGCNRSYFDLRGLPWSEAKRVYSVEDELIARMESSPNPDEEYDLIEDELYEDPEEIYGLDIGVASAAVSLSAARCVPFSSCNGGAFGGIHHEWYPVVAFFARPETIKCLMHCADEANTGLSSGDIGNLVVYADDIRNMRAFACSLMSKSAVFRKLRFSANTAKRKPRPSEDSRQLKLL